MSTYCPSKDDLVVAYGSGVTLQDGGWHIKGGNGAATKAAYDLRGGYVEFNYDVSKANTGVNTNIYTISPTIKPSGFVKNTDYCDGADHSKDGSGIQWCMEDDWVESNGPCGGATTLHTVPGPGQFCGAYGCRASYHYNGQTNMKWRIEYDMQGHMTVKRGDQTVSPSSLNPAAKDSDWAVVATTMASKGIVIYSSQWGGWVPVDSCGPAAKDPSPTVDASEFTISGLKIQGRVVQGPEPKKCSGNSTVLV